MKQTQHITHAPHQVLAGGLVHRFERNQHGRDWIVGDIHGHFNKLERQLRRAGFNPACDRLFSVGDLVDRGPDCDLVLDWLALPWFFPVQGNHEDMAIRWPNGHMPAGNYMQNGGGWNIANPPELQREIAECLAVLPVAIELETDAGLVGIVHADCPADFWSDFVAVLGDERVSKNMRNAVIDAAQWSRDRVDTGDASIVSGVRAVVVGHTPHRQMRVLGNVHFIDTFGWRDGEFTLLDAATLQPV